MFPTRRKEIAGSTAPRRPGDRLPPAGKLETGPGRPPRLAPPSPPTPAPKSARARPFLPLSHTPCRRAECPGPVRTCSGPGRRRKLSAHACRFSPRCRRAGHGSWWLMMSAGIRDALLCQRESVAAAAQLSRLAACLLDHLRPRTIKSVVQNVYYELQNWFYTCKGALKESRVPRRHHGQQPLAGRLLAAVTGASSGIR
jgi:hypothetical protein